MVCENILKANWKSFFTTSLNSTLAKVLSSTTTNATALLVNQLIKLTSGRTKPESVWVCGFLDFSFVFQVLVFLCFVLPSFLVSYLVLCFYQDFFCLFSSLDLSFLS